MYPYDTFYNMYPYSDMGNMNLDWILRKIKEYCLKVDNFLITVTLNFYDKILCFS